MEGANESADSSSARQGQGHEKENSDYWVEDILFEKNFQWKIILINLDGYVENNIDI